MAAFAEGKDQGACRTTVIEVCVNVPTPPSWSSSTPSGSAAQLTSPRRVGVATGNLTACCSTSRRSRTAEARLKLIGRNRDGFLSAGKDLELRGGGEVLGARQSGLRIPHRNVQVSAVLPPPATTPACSTRPIAYRPRGAAVRSPYLFECDDACGCFEQLRRAGSR